jgi:hypothetical protein
MPGFDNPKRTQVTNRGLKTLLPSYHYLDPEPFHNIFGKKTHLDITTGGGNFVFDLNLEGINSYGTDALISSRQLNSGFFLVDDSTELKLINNRSLDLITENYGITFHTSGVYSLITQINNMLKENPSKLISYIPDFNFKRNPFQINFDRGTIEKIFKTVHSKLKSGGEFIMTPVILNDDLRNALKKVGFEIIYDQSEQVIWNVQTLMKTFHEQVRSHNWKPISKETLERYQQGFKEIRPQMIVRVRKI